MGLMKRISFWIQKTSLRELKNLPGKQSEHMRTAIDEYIDKKHNAGTSPSVKKGGDEDANT